MKAASFREVCLANWQPPWCLFAETCEVWNPTAESHQQNTSAFENSSVLEKQDSSGLGKTVQITTGCELAGRPWNNMKTLSPPDPVTSKIGIPIFSCLNTGNQAIKYWWEEIGQYLAFGTQEHCFVFIWCANNLPCFEVKRNENGMGGGERNGTNLSNRPHTQIAHQVKLFGTFFDRTRIPKLSLCKTSVGSSHAPPALRALTTHSTRLCSYCPALPSRPFPGLSHVPAAPCRACTPNRGWRSGTAASRARTRRGWSPA